MAETFIGQVERGLAAIRAELDGGEKALHYLIVERLTGQPPEACFTLVIDQFEELFTLCEDEAERRAFIEQLLYASQVRRNRDLVILTMRADFYARVAAYKNLAEVITLNQLLVSPMTEKELREAILLPAEAVGLELEKDLVQALVHDAFDAPGALPLLQHALQELFERKDGNLLTMDAYREIKGIKGAIAHRADSIMADLTPEQRNIARRIFMRLIQPGEGTVDTRRRAAFEEVLTQTVQFDEVEGIVQTLANANLLVTSRNLDTDQVILDVSHEALIQEWPTLRGWLDEDRQGLRIRRQLSQNAQEWQAQGHSEDSLFRGARLLETEEWVAANPGEINPTEAAFLEASVIARERAKRRTQLVIAGLAIGLVVAVIGAVFGLVGQNNANIQRDQAVRQSQISLAQSLAALAPQVPNDDELATLLGIEAFHIDSQVTGNMQWLIDSTLRQILSKPYFNSILYGHKIDVFSVTFSPDGQMLAAGGLEGTIRLWDLSQPGAEPRTLHGHEASARSVAFSPDGQMLASGSEDATIRLWNLSQPEAEPRILRGYESGISSVAFSPDGQMLVCET